MPQVVYVQTVLIGLKTCVTVPRSVCINSVDDIKKKARENDDSAPPLKFNLISRAHPSVRPFASAQSDATGDAIGPFCSVLVLRIRGSVRGSGSERVSLSDDESRSVPFRFPTNVRTLRRRLVRDRVDAGAWTGARVTCETRVRGASRVPRVRLRRRSSFVVVERAFVERAVVRSKGRDALDLVDQR